MHRIMGIDPGTNILGYAVIEIDKQKIRLVELGVVRMRHYLSPEQKLKKIFTRVQKVIQEHQPEHLAIEAPFFGKNVQSMLKLGRAQGVAIAAAITKGLAITEYSPKKIKQSVTGNGNASKEQVASMLENIIRKKLAGLDLDATDALATAVCHHFQSTGALSGFSGKKNWKQFIKDNPDKIWKP